MFRVRFLLPFIAFFSFVLVLVLNLIIFFSPTSNSFEWSFLGLSKNDYANLQANFFILLTMSIILTLYVQRNEIKKYIIYKNIDLFVLKKRFLISLFIVLAFFNIFLIKIAIFSDSHPLQTSTNLALSSKKKTPQKSQTSPKSLKEFSQKNDFDLKIAISYLKIKGISKVDESIDLEKVAKKLNTDVTKLIKMFKNHERITKIK